MWKVFWAYPARKRLQGRSRTCWRNLSADLVFKWVSWRRWLVRGRHGLHCLGREAEERLHRIREWMNINIIKTKQKICPLSSVACCWSSLLFVISLCIYFLFFFSFHPAIDACPSMNLFLLWVLYPHCRRVLTNRDHQIAGTVFL